MTEIIMKQKGITLVCLQCGFQAKIEAEQVPVGNCKYCFKEFGWVLYPDWFVPRYPVGTRVLKDGDMVIVDMREPTDSRNRIYEIRRNGLVFYSKEAK